MGTLTFLLTLVLVVGIHEMGHYLACRAVGVKVEEFSIGMGPKLFGFRSTNTVWNMRCLPIGGYIRMDAAHSEIAPWKKALISVAGPAINLLPFVLLGFAFIGIMPVLQMMWSLYVGSITALLSVVLTSIDFFHWLPVGDGKNAVMGVVGMGHETNAGVAQMGVMKTFVIMFTLISIGLGMFNLVPIPPLDGGNIVLAAVEQLVGKTIARKVAVVLTTIGGLLILWAFVLITFHDIQRLF